MKFINDNNDTNIEKMSPSSPDEVDLDNIADAADGNADAAICDDVNKLDAETTACENANKPDDRESSKRRPVSDYVSNGSFLRTIEAYAKYRERKTGFTNMDRFQPLFPGLYTMGGNTAVGKTTFAHQLADQLAANGETVLYISLEQTLFELVSKSIARESYLHNFELRAKGNAPSSIDIRQGKLLSQPALLDELLKQYSAKIANRLFIIDGAFSMTVEQIKEITESVCKTGVTPVVIIDYLQIIAPSVINKRVLDNRNSIDHIVHTLKTMQSKYNLTVIAISSINRTAYNLPISFESFKESGGIEFTSDVVWGMNLVSAFDKSTSKTSAVSKPTAPKLKTIELVYLKNRFGLQNQSLKFRYHPANDFFEAISSGLS